MILSVKKESPASMTFSERILLHYLEMRCKRAQWMMCDINHGLSDLTTELVLVNELQLTLNLTNLQVLCGKIEVLANTVDNADIT